MEFKYVVNKYRYDKLMLDFTKAITENNAERMSTLGRMIIDIYLMENFDKAVIVDCKFKEHLTEHLEILEQFEANIKRDIDFAEMMVDAEMDALSKIKKKQNKGNIFDMNELLKRTKENR